MLREGQNLTAENLNKVYISKQATGTQLIQGDLKLIGSYFGNGRGLINLQADKITTGTGGATIGKTVLPPTLTYTDTAATINTNRTMNGILYFANGTNYYIDNSANAKLLGLTLMDSLTVTKDLEVQGQIKHNHVNEFPDPLMQSGDLTRWGTATNVVIAFQDSSVAPPANINAYGSLKITSNPSITDGYTYYDYYFDVTQNEWITFSAFAFSTTSSNSTEYAIFWYDASKVDITNSNTTVSNTATSWTRYTVTGQAPAGARYFRLRLDSNTSNAITYFTGFQIERGRAMTGFKPYTGSGWTGSGLTTLPKLGGGIGFFGTKPNSGYGIGSLNFYNESDGTAGNTWGRVTSKGNFGISLKYGADIIQIGAISTKIGIGTATPSAKAEIIGYASAYAATPVLYLDTGSTAVNSDLVFGSAGTQKWALSSQSVTLDHDFIIYGYNSGWQPYIAINRSSGNVGIGVTTPSGTLTVHGTSTNGTGMFMRSDLSSTYSYIHSGATGDWYIRPALISGKIIIADMGGNVGIGTATPGQKLDVLGNANVSGSLTVGSFAPSSIAMGNKYIISYNSTEDSLDFTYV